MNINPYGRTIGIVGTRRRNSAADAYVVREAFFMHYTPGDWICSGGCPKGGDVFAYKIHKDHNIPYLEFPADWRPDGIYNAQAGFERNTFIAYVSDMLIACVANDREGGTEDTIRKFESFHEFGTLVLV